MNEDVVRTRLAQIDAELDLLYWAFTRQKRGKPPACVRPELYTERKELKARLRQIIASKGNGQG